MFRLVALIVVVLGLATPASPQRGSLRKDYPLPSPTVNVYLPSDVHAIVIGVLTVIVAALTLTVLYRQLGVFRNQATLLEHQTTLLENQEKTRATEAAGTLYRIADDLVEEFRKANDRAAVAEIFSRIRANTFALSRTAWREIGRLVLDGTVAP